MSSTTSRRESPAAVAAALIATSAILVVALLAAQRREGLTTGRRLTDSFARVIEEQTTRTMQTIDQRLQLASIEFEQMSVRGAPSDESARAILRAQMRALPYVRAMWTTDASGHIRFDSDPGIIGLDVADRSYFAALRADPRLEFFVANPVRSRTDGSWLLCAARPLRAPDGSFAGVIVAAITPMYLDALWRSVDLGADGAVTLLRNDGTLLMRSPFDSVMEGRNFGSNSSLALIRTAPSGHYALASPLDGIERDVAFRHLALLPDVAVLVGQSTAFILAPWRRFALLVTLVWGLASLATIAWAVTATRARRQRAADDEALRSSEQNLSITLQSIGDAVIATDASGHVRRMNPTAERLTGWRLDEAVGQPLSTVFPVIDTTTRAPMTDPVALVLERGAVVELANHAALLSRDGHEYQIADSAAPIRDETGDVVGVVLVFTDVTESYRAALALRESEQQLRFALAGADLGIWDWDVPTNRLAVNARWMTMLGLDAEGPPPDLSVWHTMVLPEDVHKLDELVSTVIFNPDGREFEAEIRARHRKGHTVWILDKGAVVSRADDGAPLRVVGTHMDITARKEAEAASAAYLAQLRESQKMEAIGTLAGGVAHDFNNVLAAVLGNVELALDDENLSHATRDHLDSVRQSADRGRSVVQQILAFSRRQPMERQPSDLGPVLENTERLLRATLPTRIELEVVAAPDLPPVRANVAQIEQVLINLATNAMHAIGRERGQITIRAAAVRANVDDVVVRLTVRDTGGGIEPAVLNRIFEPFFTTKPVGEGTGLGLAVVHGIVLSHEGTISVESAPGDGTCFTIDLPGLNASPTPVPSVIPADTATASTRPATRARVLYVDDDPALVRLIAKLLERRGFSVAGFTEQGRAIDAVRADPQAFDIVLTDFNMRGLSGVDVARAVRAIRANLPVVLMSGFVDEDTRDRAVAAGVSEVVLKGTSADEISRVVERLLR